MPTAQVLDGPGPVLDLDAVGRKLAELEGAKRSEAIAAITEVVQRVADRLLYAAGDTCWEAEDREGRVLVSFSANAYRIAVLEFVFDELHVLDGRGRFVIARNGRTLSFPIPGSGPACARIEISPATLTDNSAPPRVLVDGTSIVADTAGERLRTPWLVGVRAPRAVRASASVAGKATPADPMAKATCGAATAASGSSSATINTEKAIIRPSCTVAGARARYRRPDVVHADPS